MQDQKIHFTDSIDSAYFKSIVFAAGRVKSQWDNSSPFVSLAYDFDFTVKALMISNSLYRHALTAGTFPNHFLASTECFDEVWAEFGISMNNHL